jgi:hypothetical protein
MSDLRQFQQLAPYAGPEPSIVEAGMSTVRSLPLLGVFTIRRPWRWATRMRARSLDLLGK